MHRCLLCAVLYLLPLCLLPPTAAATPAWKPAGLQAVHHVFVLVLENEPYRITFGKHSPAPYLAHTLPKQGAMLSQYYGIGHHSLDNYDAIISGQAPNPDTQKDCPVMSEFKPSGAIDANGQLPGHGCVYPPKVKTVADQLEARGLTWKGYMEDMGADPKREAAPCGHVPIGAKDHTNHASLRDEYADKHNPFVYFHSIIDDRVRCNTHVVNLDVLKQDLKRIATTPNLAFITPGLCHDGHDAPCANGEAGGLISADAFLRTWVPRIMASPAFRKDGLLVITFDEGTSGAACCNEQALPSGPKPGKYGPGGGRIGAVLLSPVIRPGTISNRPYNHYSLLRSIEDIFGMGHLGYAAAKGVRPFGKDVFSAR